MPLFMFPAEKCADVHQSTDRVFKKPLTLTHAHTRKPTLEPELKKTDMFVSQVFMIVIVVPRCDCVQCFSVGREAARQNTLITVGC